MPARAARGPGLGWYLGTNSDMRHYNHEPSPKSMNIAYLGRVGALWSGPPAGLARLGRRAAR